MPNCFSKGYTNMHRQQQYKNGAVPPAAPLINLFLNNRLTSFIKLTFVLLVGFMRCSFVTWLFVSF